MLLTLGDTKQCRLFTHSEGISSLLEEQDIKMSSDVYEPLQALRRREHLGAAFFCFLTGRRRHGLCLPECHPLLDGHDHGLRATYGVLSMHEAPSL